MSNDYLSEYSGPLPPVRGFSISINNEAILIIGHIVVQWGILVEKINWELEFNEKNPNIPKDIRNIRVRSELKHKIKRLRELAPYFLKDARNNAVEVYTEKLNLISQLKHIRDSLAHGAFALKDNEIQGRITVIYKRKKYTYTIQKLIETVKLISECNGFLCDYYLWAYYETHLALHKNLQELGHRK